VVLDFAAIKEDRNTVKLNEAAELFCVIPSPHRSRVLRECRGNACHTTGHAGGVLHCYTADGENQGLSPCLAQPSMR
jgi:hypothetical protein